MAIFPVVMSGSGTCLSDWTFIHFKIGYISCKSITYKRYWFLSWGMIIMGTILQLCSEL